MPKDKDQRPKPDQKVIADVRERAENAGRKVIVHPTPAQIKANPGARGYDEKGNLKPADARAVFIVVPPDPAAEVADQEEEPQAPAPTAPTETGAAAQTPAASGPEPAGESTPAAGSGATGKDS